MRKFFEYEVAADDDATGLREKRNANGNGNFISNSYL